MKKLLILLAIILIAGCTNSRDATKALHSMGFTNVKITGYHWFACAGDDFYHTGFAATNAIGMPVYGTVCSGLFIKGSTVRF